MVIKRCRLRSVIIEGNSNDRNTIVNVLGLPQGYNFIHTKKFFIPNINSTWRILRDSAQIYDPLGLLAPVTVKAKIMVQILWKWKLDWDEPLDQELTKEWSTIVDDIIEATSITYPRLYFMPNNQISSQTTQLHIFVDVSLRAYEAVTVETVNFNKTADNCSAVEH